MSSYGAVYRWLERIVCDPDTPLEPCDWMLVAEIDSRVVGYVAVSRNHVENLYVDPEVQGRGVGRQLLAAVEERVVGPITPSGVPLSKPRWFKAVCSAVNCWRESATRSRGHGACTPGPPASRCARRPTANA